MPLSWHESFASAHSCVVMLHQYVITLFQRLNPYNKTALPYTRMSPFVQRDVPRPPSLALTNLSDWSSFLSPALVTRHQGLENKRYQVLKARNRQTIGSWTDPCYSCPFSTSCPQAFCTTGSTRLGFLSLVVLGKWESVRFTAVAMSWWGCATVLMLLTRNLG